MLIDAGYEGTPINVTKNASKNPVEIIAERRSI